MKKVSALPVFRVVLPAVQFDDEFRRTRPDGGCELSFLHPSDPSTIMSSAFPVLSAEAASESFVAAPPLSNAGRRPAASKSAFPPRNGAMPFQPARPTFTRRRLGG